MAQGTEGPHKEAPRRTSDHRCAQHQQRPAQRVFVGGASGQMERMEDFARLRAVQERRRGMEAARRAQDDYERKQADLLHGRIAPLRTFGYQMNERQRVAQTILNG